MADEITVTVALALLKGELDCPERSESFTPNMTGDAMTHAVQQVGLTKENLALSADIGTAGWCYIKNLDAANYVDVGLDADTPFMKLKAGEACLFRLASTTISCKANTSAVNVEYWVIED